MYQKLRLFFLFYGFPILLPPMLVFYGCPIKVVELIVIIVMLSIAEFGVTIGESVRYTCSFYCLNITN